jgi:Protein of unknown function (DUF2589)
MTCVQFSATDLRKMDYATLIGGAIPFWLSFKLLLRRCAKSHPVHCIFDAFVGPLSAVLDAQAKATTSTLSYITNMGFDTSSTKRATTVQFSYETTNPETGLLRTEAVNVPLITLIPITFLKIESVSMDLTIRLSGNTQTNIMTSSALSPTLPVAAEKYFKTSTFQAELVNQGGSGPQGATSFTMNIQTGHFDTPSGLTKLLSIMDEAIIRGTI